MSKINSLNNSNDEQSIDSYEKRLDKEIEENCNFQEYVDNLEVEEKSLEDLLLMSKENIIDFKDYQIKKYKAYITSLEQEKIDLISNFKETTNILLERIKELEEKTYGQRPQTALIMKNIQSNQFGNGSFLNQNKKIMSKEQLEVELIVSNRKKDDEEQKEEKEDKERCVKCKTYILKSELPKHSLICLRNAFIQCKICKESINDNEKSAHLLKYRDYKYVYQSIISKNRKVFENCLDHGFDVNIIYDTEKRIYPVHVIIQMGVYEIFKSYIERKLNLDLYDKEMNNLIVRIYITHILPI